MLGEDEIKSNGYIYNEYKKESNVLFIRNLNFEENEMFISSSEKIDSYTGSRV